MKAWLLGGLFLAIACQEQGGERAAGRSPASGPPRTLAPLGASLPSSLPLGPTPGGPPSAALRAALRAAEQPLADCVPLPSQWVVVLRFVLDPSGHVSSARVVGDLAQTEAARCLVSTLESLSLPPFTGEPVQVSYPLALGLSIEPLSLAEASIPVPGPASLGSQPAPSSQASASQPLALSKQAPPLDPLLDAERWFALREFSSAEQALAPLLASEKAPPEAHYLAAALARERGDLAAMCREFRLFAEAKPSAPATPGVLRQLESCAPKPTP